MKVFVSRENLGHLAKCSILSWKRARFCSMLPHICMTPQLQMIFLFGCSAAGTSDLQLRMLRFLANLACFNFQFCVAKGLTQLLIFAGV